MGLHFVPSQPLGFISASFSCKATRLYNPRQAWIAQGEKKTSTGGKKGKRKLGEIEGFLQEGGGWPMYQQPPALLWLPTSSSLMERPPATDG